MRRFRFIPMVLATMLALPTVAQARPASPFTETAVPAAELAQARGGRSPFALLSVGNTTRLLEGQSFADLRQTGSIARVSMDIWWAQTGGELIAANVRATLP